MEPNIEDLTDFTSEWVDEPTKRGAYKTAEIDLFELVRSAPADRQAELQAFFRV